MRLGKWDINRGMSLENTREVRRFGAVSYTHLDVYKRQVVDGKKVTIEVSTGVRGEIRDAETQCSLWMGYTEFSQDVLVLKKPYRNLLTEYDGRLTFVRQTDSAQNG